MDFIFRLLFFCHMIDVSFVRTMTDADGET